jgi:uncharacterized membrane-anchored protein
MTSTKFAVLVAVAIAAPSAIIAFPYSAPASAQDAQKPPAEAARDAASEDDPFAQALALGWVKGPATVSITDRAKVTIPKGYMYLGEEDTSKFLTLNGNLPQKGRYTIAKKDFRWFAVYGFQPDGYVRDNEVIDPVAIFKSMKDSEPAENEERRAAGLEPMYLDGWVVEPHYDTATRQLEWGTRFHSKTDKDIVNYTSRILGRGGVMSAVLVSDPEELEKDLADFRKTTKNFEYVAGERYAEFQNGDRVAQYGLGALIVGGAAAAAAKSGVGKAAVGGIAAFGKLIFAGIAAAFLGLVSFIKGLFRRKET